MEWWQWWGRVESRDSVGKVEGKKKRRGTTAKAKKRGIYPLRKICLLSLTSRNCLLSN